VYDPRRSNDRLLLGMKGTTSVLGLSLFRQRSQEALKQMANRGALILGVAAGYVKVERDRIRNVLSALVSRHSSPALPCLISISTCSALTLEQPCPTGCRIRSYRRLIRGLRLSISGERSRIAFEYLFQHRFDAREFVEVGAR
jgi:hypothetical protein